MLADAEDAEDRSAAQRATTEQSQDMCDFDEDVVIEGEPPMVVLQQIWFYWVISTYVTKWTRSIVFL